MPEIVCFGDIIHAQETKPEIVHLEEGESIEGVLYGAFGLNGSQLVVLRVADDICEAINGHKRLIDALWNIQLGTLVVITLRHKGGRNDPYLYEVEVEDEIRYQEWIVPEDDDDA